MDESFLLGFAQNVVILIVILAGPVLLMSLLIGSLISLFQAATQINEVTLTFVPKIVGVGIILILLGSWMTQQLIAFTTSIFTNLPNLPR